MADPTAPCPAGFHDLFESVYSTFTIILNMVTIERYEVQDKVSLYVLHCFFVFVVAITMLNFLIAILSNDVSDVMQNIDI